MYQKVLREKEVQLHLTTQHLKVKKIAQDIILIKNYCITINMQKISSIHKSSLKIQQIFGSHEIKDHACPKNIEGTFSFPEFEVSCKKSVYSTCSTFRHSQC